MSDVVVLFNPLPIHHAFYLWPIGYPVPARVDRVFKEEEEVH